MSVSRFAFFSETTDPLEPKSLKKISQDPEMVLALQNSRSSQPSAENQKYLVQPGPTVVIILTYIMKVLNS